jgi:hypothetical protein
MRGVPRGRLLLVLAVAISLPALATPAAGDRPKDWVRALRNNDKEAFQHVREAGVDEEAFLKEALRHRDADWRIAAAQRLGDLQASWAVEALQAMTDDRNPGVSIAARLALRALGLGGGMKPFAGLVYPGADLDKKVSEGGAVEFTLLSRDGARNVIGFYERALGDQGWERLREAGEGELPQRCRAPWGGAYGRGNLSFLVIVCGSSAPGELAVIRIKVREAWAEKVFGRAIEGSLKDTGIR